MSGLRSASEFAYWSILVSPGFAINAAVEDSLENKSGESVNDVSDPRNSRARRAYCLFQGLLIPKLVI